MFRVIFHADDDIDDAAILEEAIKEYSPEVVYKHFRNGQELVDYVNSDYIPDIFIVDLNMPRLDGKSCIAYLRTNQALKDVPILVLTTSNSLFDAKACSFLGADYYIVKPDTQQGLHELGTAIATGELKSSIQPCIEILHEVCYNIVHTEKFWELNDGQALSAVKAAFFTAASFIQETVDQALLKQPEISIWCNGNQFKFNRDQREV